MTGAGIFSSIMLGAHSQYRFFQLELCKLIKQRYTGEIHLYCGTREEKTFWDKQNVDGLFDSVLIQDRGFGQGELASEDFARTVERAQALEIQLGITLNQLAIADRHLGRGYALTGFYHPRSRESQSTDYQTMVRVLLRRAHYWQEQVAERQPTLLIDCGKLGALVARNVGVPYRTIAGSRYKNLHQWASNEFFENPQVQAAYVGSARNAAAEIEAPYYSHMTLRSDFNRRVGFGQSLKQTAHLIAKRAYWRLRGYEKGKNYFARDELRYIWRKRADTLWLSRHTRPLSSLEGTPFVYYPLHTEPEISLQVLSPEYFFQHTTIAALSRDLPAGTLLAVKETFDAVGRRPRDFYQQILDLKNVVLLDMMELGLDVVRHANATATITGTGGFEAAVMGKPVLAFGRHNQYSFVPHVRTITDVGDLTDDLNWALSPDFDHTRAASDGSRFLGAIEDISFDMRDYDYIHLDKFDHRIVEDAFVALHESLEVGLA